MKHFRGEMAAKNRVRESGAPTEIEILLASLLPISWLVIQLNGSSVSVDQQVARCLLVTAAYLSLLCVVTRRIIVQVQQRGAWRQATLDEAERHRLPLSELIDLQVVDIEVRNGRQDRVPDETVAISHGNTWRANRRTRVVVLMLLAVHAVMLGVAAGVNSYVWTEVGLLPSGLVHWRTGEFETFRVNPPGLRMWATLPLAAAHIELPNVAPSQDSRERAEWKLGRDFIIANGTASFWFLLVARWCCIPISLLGGWICYRWALEWFGPGSALLATSLWCFSPNILAHGHLITGDVAATTFGLATCYAFWHWTQDASWYRALILGISLGLALSSKLTWIILLGFMPCVAAFAIWSTRHQRSSVGRLSMILQATGAIWIGLLVLNATYGFTGTFRQVGDYHFVSATLAGSDVDDQRDQNVSNRFLGTLIEWAPLPFPQDYVLGLDLQRWDVTRPRWSYLRGQWRDIGWWYYYLYAMLVKIPLGTWMLVVLSALSTVCRNDKQMKRRSIFLLAPGLLLVVLVSSQVGLNKHLRYLLPAFPFIYLFASTVFADSAATPRSIRFLVCLALSWSIVSSIACFPHSISYFNEAVGGPRKGPQHLLSSNVDWGQDLLHLTRWVSRERKWDSIQVQYDPLLIRPETVGLRSLKMIDLDSRFNSTGRPSPQLPSWSSGWYAISVNQLYRRDRRFQSFRDREPTAMVGYSIYIYEVRE